MTAKDIDTLIAFLAISLAVIIVGTLIISGLILLTTGNSALTASITPWIALTVAVVWSIFCVTFAWRLRKQKQ